MSLFWRVFWMRLFGWGVLALTMFALAHQLLARPVSWIRVGAALVMIAVAIRAYAGALRTARSSGSVSS